MVPSFVQIPDDRFHVNPVEATTLYPFQHLVHGGFAGQDSQFPQEVLLEGLAFLSSPTLELDVKFPRDFPNEYGFHWYQLSQGAGVKKGVFRQGRTRRVTPQVRGAPTRAVGRFARQAAGPIRS